MDAGPGSHVPDAGEAASRLVDLVHELLEEAHPGRHRVIEATLDSSLDKALGLDSLARVELLTRIERSFSVEMPGAALGAAETLRDLLKALLAAGPRIEAHRRVSVDEHRGGVLPVPEGASTLIEALSWHVEAHPERRHAFFYRTADETETLTYGELWRGASAVAAGLTERGLAPGQAVAIMLPSGFEFFFAFFGSLLAGGVPVPLYPPARLSQIEDHLKRQAGILRNSLAPILITVREATLAARLLKGHAPELREIATVGELRAARPNALRPRIKADDIAFLQYTSGSTGNPKGVVLTHANLLANLRAWGRAARFDSNDVAVSWLPLYHDLGLIGAWLGSLYNGGLVVLLSPLDFLARPERWLWAIHTHRGTASAAPNFAFELCLRRIEDRDIEGLDLGSWRLAANGAEPVIPDTLRRFTERFAPYGFRAEAMAPVFGLAECTVGLAIPPMGRKPIVDRIERAPFIERRLAVPARADDEQVLEFVACGRVLPGHEMRIVDHEDRELPERSVGHLQFRGPSATRGYFRNPEETARLIHGEWLDSGDLGYIADGDLYVTGRVKDTIIRGGRNILPHALEEAVGGLPGVRKGCVAVFGVPDPAGGTERLVVVAETREGEPSVLEGLRQRINALAVELIETPVDEVVLAPPQSVLKTSSGKIRRAATRELYQRGKLGRTAGAPWLQVARLALSGAPGQLTRLARATAAYLYAAYAWIAFALVALIDWVTVLITPSLKWRWQATQGAHPPALAPRGASGADRGHREAVGQRAAGVRREPHELSRRAGAHRDAPRTAALRGQARVPAHPRAADPVLAARHPVRRALRCREGHRRHRAVERGRARRRLAHGLCRGHVPPRRRAAAVPDGRLRDCGLGAAAGRAGRALGRALCAAAGHLAPAPPPDNGRGGGADLAPRERVGTPPSPCAMRPASRSSAAAASPTWARARQVRTDPPAALARG